jgi:site-specific DNA recombinase
MAAEVAATAMRAYAEETNRLNRARRSNGDAWRVELEKTERDLERAVDLFLPASRRSSSRTGSRCSKRERRN